METTFNQSQTSFQAPSKGALWTGRIISIICVLFLLFDSISKIFREIHTVQACVKLGWPDSTLQGVGTVLLISTILYAIPRTAVLGAILVTAYLGGATAVQVRIDYSYIFPVIFGILVWTGLALRDPELRKFIPLRKAA